jgi:hypothetical protein
LTNSSDSAPDDMLYRTTCFQAAVPLDLARLSSDDVDFAPRAHEWFIRHPQGKSVAGAVGGASTSKNRLRPTVHAPFQLDPDLAHCLSFADIPADTALGVRANGFRWRRMLQYRCDEAASSWPPVGWVAHADPSPLDPDHFLIAPTGAAEFSTALAVDGGTVQLNDVGDAVLSARSSIHAAQCAAGVWQFEGVFLQAMRAGGLVDRLRERRDKGDGAGLVVEGIALSLRFVADGWDAEASIVAEEIAGLISTLDLATHETLIASLEGVTGLPWYLEQILKCVDRTQEDVDCDSDTLTACSAARVAVASFLSCKHGL